jgi:hypothetical protein
MNNPIHFNKLTQIYKRIKSQILTISKFCQFKILNKKLVIKNYQHNNLAKLLIFKEINKYNYN